MMLAEESKYGAHNKRLIELKGRCRRDRSIPSSSLGLGEIVFLNKWKA